MGSLPVNGNAQPTSKLSSFSAGPCKFLSPYRELFHNRSPLESPPLPKRPLHFVEGGRQLPKTSDSSNTISCFLGSRSVSAGESGKENPSILKAGSPRKSRSKDTASRKVNFRQKVVVFHFDRNEGSHVCSESQTLNCEPPTRKNFASQPIQRLAHPSTAVTLQHQNSLQRDAGNTSRRNSKGTPVPQRRPFLSDKIPAAEESRPIQLKDLNFHYVIDDNRTSILRFSLPLGVGISSTDVIVKANKTGNRVRILSTESGLAKTGQRCREINERFGLPVRVDSYHICARMDSSGVLYVEAPVLPGELKPVSGQNSTRRST